MFKRFYITVFIIGVGFSLDTPASTIAFEIGIPREVTVVAGTSFDLDFQIRNTGDSSLEFGLVSELNKWIPSASGLAFGGGDWNPLEGVQSSGYAEQFNGNTISPGDSLTFFFRTFQIPNLAIGSLGQFRASLQFLFKFSSDPLDQLFAGNLLGGTNLPSFSDQPLISFVIGDSEFVSDPTFSQACIVDRNTGSVVSGPPGTTCDPINPSAIPIPAAIWLFVTALVGLIGFSKRRKIA